jgi:hypothetical protein
MDAEHFSTIERHVGVAPAKNTFGKLQHGGW